MLEEQQIGCGVGKKTVAPLYFQHKCQILPALELSILA